MFKRRALLGAIALLCVLLVAACGGHAHKKPSTPSSNPKTSVASLASSCPPNNSYMGCAQARLSTPTAPRLSPPTGALFPDVSDWQGAVNWGDVAAWQRAHRWKLAGIFKLGEYTLDPYAARNSQQLAALGFWHAGYWFVRNTGCAHEASLIVWAAQRYGQKIVVNDEEEPEAYGYDTCLTAVEKKAGLIVVTYTGPGTWPGGPFASNPAWTATYNARFGCLVWTCHPLAWQFTDGRFGAVTYVPGVGSDDVSVDYGITKLGVKPNHLVCFPKPSNAAKCAPILKKVAAWRSAAKASQGAVVGTQRAEARLKVREQMFHQRVTYFNGQVAKTIKAYS